MASVRWPSEFAKPSLLILQGTPFCNIDCAYCYLPQRAAKHRMGLAPIERLCAALVEEQVLGPKLRVSWHAGEPLAMPRDEFASAVRAVRESLGPHTDLTLSLQTNGILVDDHWVRFIKDNEIRVGVSLDGPAKFHNIYRRDRRGKGTHEAAMRGVRLLQAAGVEVSVICVLHEQSLKAPDLVFDFFSDAGLNLVCFNVEETAGTHVSETFAGADVRGHARAFFKRYFERAAQHSAPHWVRELNGILSALEPHGASPRAQVSQPGRVLSMDWRGRVSTFSPELLTWHGEDAERFQFIDILTTSLSALAEQPAFQTAYREIERGYEACRESCGYFRFCGGGAPAAKLAERGNFAVTETSYCQTKVMASVDAFLDILVDGAPVAQAVAADHFET